MLDICQLSPILKIVMIQPYKGGVMHTVSIFKNGRNQAIRLPKEMEFEGVQELEIIKEGNCISLRPVKPDWISFADSEKAERDFLTEREAVISDEGRFNW